MKNLSTLNLVLICAAIGVLLWGIIMYVLPILYMALVVTCCFLGLVIYFNAKKRNRDEEN